MKQISTKILVVFFSSVVILLLSSCGPTKVLRSLKNPDQIDTKTQSEGAVKIHMKDGGLYLLSDPVYYPAKDTLVGSGNYYNADRRKISSSNQINSLPNIGNPTYKIALSDIAVVETNTIKGISGKLLSMSLIGVPSALTAAYCLTNPKACFGSCPTFYAWNGESMKLMAEGFSSSILPIFEKSDIDMLYWSKTRGKDYQIKLTNEALETHIIRYANLLVFPKSGQERIFATDDGQFYKTNKIQSPVSCKGPEGDCTNLVLQMDGSERFSQADSKNLATKECIEMEFNTTSKNQIGLIIGSRQTLLTTYLFYQSIANLGNANGYFVSKIESGENAIYRKVEKIWDLLGGIEIFIQNSSGKWLKAGEVEEMGPIATDVHLINLPPQGTETTKIRLKMTKGLWRIDYLGLTETSNPVQPIQIKPSLVITNDTINDIALTNLCDSNEPLITLPGDSHILHYTLPDTSDEYEIFIKSKGYYLEWMREEWMAEQNLKKAYLMFGMPKLYLKLVADKFKVVEPTMEETFWRSRYVKN